MTTKSQLQAVDGVPDFWQRVIEAPHRLLGLDYDGTLAPFHVIREAAVPVPGIADVLSSIRQCCSTSVVIVSGRPAKEVRNLMGTGITVPIIGAHGYERTNSNGDIECVALDDHQRKGLALARDLAARAGHEPRLEHKVASLALHTREVFDSQEIQIRVQLMWKPVADEHDLQIMPFNGGIEIRARGHDKGSAFAGFYAEMQMATLAVYIGDDTTDEDVFKFVRPIGIGVRVGDATVPTEASGHLSDPAAVFSLLQSWQRAFIANGIQ